VHKRRNLRMGETLLFKSAIVAICLICFLLSPSGAQGPDRAAARNEGRQRLSVEPCA